MSKLTMPDGAVYETAPGEAAKATWDGETTSHAVLKSEPDKRFTLSMGYPAMSADIGVARDGHRDFANQDEVEKAAWAYLRNGASVGLYHQEGTEGHGDVVESYIYRGPDWQVNDQVVKSGDWLVGIIWDEPTWDAIQKGEINGTSMQGRAARRTPNPADVARVKARRG